MKTDAKTIIDQLRTLAGSVAFSTLRTRDDSFRWDGDGPDPRDEGFECYDVEVRAQTIVYGTMLEESEYMGGHYDKPGKDKDADLGGYLPQMLQGACDSLAKILKANCPEQAVTLRQLDAASVYLSEVMRHRHAEQMATR